MSVGEYVRCNHKCWEISGRGSGETDRDVKGGGFRSGASTRWQFRWIGPVAVKPEEDSQLKR